MAKTVSGEVQGDESKQTTGEVSNLYKDDVKIEDYLYSRISLGEHADYPSDVRHKSGVTLIQALVWNVGTCCPDGKGETQMRGPHKGESTDAGHRGGAVRSREEGSVMGLDRRGCIVQLYLRVNQKWEEPYG